ncbi:MAG: putative addiction module antidote protein [Rhodoferax sp.]|nr:putative addiction module antidote protein [Rhodoferax sp.]
MKDRSHDEAMAELFRQDPAFAAEYINQLLQDGEPADLLVALRQMAQAHGGGMHAVAREAELSATQLYRTLSSNGNPELRSLSALLKVLGLRLAVQTIAQPASR